MHKYTGRTSLYSDKTYNKKITAATRPYSIKIYTARQNTANQEAKGHISEPKRPCFAQQKATYSNALKISKLYHIHASAPKHVGRQPEIKTSCYGNTI